MNNTSFKHLHPPKCVPTAHNDSPFRTQALLGNHLGQCLGRFFGRFLRHFLGGLLRQLLINSSVRRVRLLRQQGVLSHFFLRRTLLTCLIVCLSVGVNVWSKHALSGPMLYAQESSAGVLKGEMLPYTFVGEKYVPGESSIKGYLSLPEEAEARPAIILIHEWWGLNDDIKRKADEFASQGYVAFAVDLYEGKATTDASKARALSGAVRKDVPAAFANLKSAIAFLKNHPRVDGTRIGSVGWCFGGGWSYQLAKNNLNMKASVIYYGFFNPSDDLSKMRTEIIGHFAENDRGIKVDTVRELQVKLKTLNGDHEIYIYPNTTHGFASRKGSNPIYKETEAKLAMKRTLAFLKKYL